MGLRNSEANSGGLTGATETNRQARSNSNRNDGVVLKNHSIISRERITGKHPIMQRLSIAHLTPYYAPSIGGVEYVAQYLAEGLARRSHCVDVLTTLRSNHKPACNGLVPMETMNGVRVHRFPHLLSLGHMSFFPGVLMRMHREGYGIVHMHSLRHPHTILGALHGLKYGCVPILHGHAHFTAGDPLKSMAYRMADRILFPACYQRLSHVVAITESEKTAYIRRGITASKISVIPNCVLDEFFQPSDSGAFRYKHRLHGSRIILFIGHIQHAKRVDLIIRALQEVRQRISNVQFVAAGPDQGAMHQCRRLAESLNVGQSVRFFGELDPPELRQALAAADMLVLPSDYEAFGIVIAEAMAAGKPVIATRSPGPSAVVRHGVTGYLVAHEDYGGIARHAIQLLENPLLAKAMGEAGRCEAEQYRVDGIIDRFENLYLELLANRRRGI